MDTNETITAEAGQDSNMNLVDGHIINSGGSGYCGGGGYGFSYKGSGGTDGGDGEEGYSAPGGNGAGEDISDYNTFLAFSLSPGAGGQYVGNLYGGGGGGVLINGAGPVASINHGQGYGGGGPGGLEGLPGVILKYSLLPQLLPLLLTLILPLLLLVLPHLFPVIISISSTSATFYMFSPGNFKAMNDH